MILDRIISICDKWVHNFHFLYAVVQWSDFLATGPEVQVRLMALPDLLRSSGSLTGSTEPHEYNWGAIIEKGRSGSGLENREYDGRDLSRWPRGILHLKKMALTSPTSGGRSVGRVRLRTQATEFSLVFVRIHMGTAILTHDTHRSRLRTATNIVLFHFAHFYSGAAGDDHCTVMCHDRSILAVLT
jgi:hypothetical protein